MKKNFFFISCDEAKHICDKSQYGESSSWECTKLKMRLLFCKITKSYAKNNNKLSEAFRKANINCLKNTERRQLEEKFQEELAKHK